MRLRLDTLLLLLTGTEASLYVKADDKRVGGSIDYLVVEPKPTENQERQQEGQRYSSFWQLNDLNASQKTTFGDQVKAVNVAQQYIDWDLLKDRYLLAAFDGARRLEKRSPRKRKRRKGWKTEQNEHSNAKQDTAMQILGLDAVINHALDAAGNANIASKQAAKEKEEKIKNLNAIIGNALTNAGLGDLAKQILQAEIRVQNINTTDDSIGGNVTDDAVGVGGNLTDDTAGVDDDVLAPSGNSTTAGDDTTAPGGNSTSTDDDATSPTGNSTSTDDATSPSGNSTSTDDATSPGTNSTGNGDDQPATGDDKTVDGDDATPSGSNSTTTGDDQPPAVGDDGTATGDDNMKPAVTKSPAGSGDNNGGKEFITIPKYEYNKGNCPDAGDSIAKVPCAPDNLDQLCDKYQEGSSFTKCWEACIPSFCCIHDAPPETNKVAPNCNEDSNCAQYAFCYIVWWKLHDTIGPASQLKIEQNDDFFDLSAEAIQSDVTGVDFFREMLFHHFDDSAEIIRLGTVQVSGSTAKFDSDLIFLNATYWNTTI